MEEFAHGKNAREELRCVAKLFPTKFRYARFLARSAINFPVFSGRLGGRLDERTEEGRKKRGIDGLTD